MTASQPAAAPDLAPIVWTDRAVAADPSRSAVHAAVTIALGPGLQSVVGTAADGTFDIAPLVSGITPRRGGTVRVAGRDPVRDPDLRGRIGVTFAEPELPSCPRVEDFFALLPPAAVSASAALARFGIGHWSERRTSSLSRREKRAIELVLALSVPHPVAIVLTEPAVDIADLDRDAVKKAAAQAADAGACVVVLTSSIADAIELSGHIHLVEAGRIVRSVPAAETGALVPGRGVTLRIDTDLPRIIAAQLADDPAVTGIDWDQEQRSVLSVRGPDLDQLATAVARAATSSGAAITSIAPVAPGLEEVRAASAGLALAAYHAAYKAWAQGPAAPPIPAAPPTPAPTPSAPPTPATPPDKEPS